MCVIAVVKRGFEMNKEELENCFRGNPDGAGMMYYDEKKSLVHIKKGFFTFDEFWNEASKLPDSIDRVFHFRIATSGAISAETCHPFSVCNNYKEMGLPNNWTKIGMVHNGVMHDYTPKAGLKSKHSDTMQFIKEVVNPLGDSVWNPAVQELWETAMGSNKYVLVGDGQVAVIGDFVQSEVSGALYSNTSYIGYRYKTTNAIKPWYDDSYYDSYYWGTTSSYGCQTTKKDVKKEFPVNFGKNNTTMSTDEFGVNYLPIEVWTGKMDDEKLEEFLDDAEYELYSYDVSILDIQIKEFSVVLYVNAIPDDLPSVICGKKWLSGNYEYTVK